MVQKGLRKQAFFFWLYGAPGCEANMCSSGRHASGTAAGCPQGEAFGCAKGRINHAGAAAGTESGMVQKGLRKQTFFGGGVALLPGLGIFRPTDHVRQCHL